MGIGGIGRPEFVGAVGILAVNDHILKPQVGGWWTGKLSDVAGVFVVTVVVGLVTGRPNASGVAVGTGFTALKVVPAVAVAAAPVLGGVTRSDPTDLVALVVILPAPAFLRREERTEPGRGLVVVSSVLAVLVTTATSCESSPVVDAFVVTDDGSVHARISEDLVDESGETQPSQRWAESDDGGVTWRSSTEPKPEASMADQARAPAIGCFRTRYGLVQQSEAAAGPWRTSFAFTHEQRERMDLRQACGEGRAVPTVIAVVDRPDGDHVVVAMESQGVLHRSPDGQWERRGVLDLDPTSTWGPSWLSRLGMAPVAVFVGAVVLLATNRVRRAAASMALVGAVTLLFVSAVLGFVGLDYVVAGPLIAAASVVLFVVSLVMTRRPRPAA